MSGTLSETTKRCPMTRVVRFLTAKFDVSRERVNPINPIAGESLLLWLQQKARPVLELSPPEPEDWGWYALASWKGRQYLVGSSAAEEEEKGLREWVLQVEKQRSLREKLLGQEKMAAADECADFLQRLLEAEPGFRDVSVDPD